MFTDEYLPSWKIVIKYVHCPECDAEAKEQCKDINGIHRARREMFLIINWKEKNDGDSA